MAAKTRRYSKSAQKTVESAMRRRKRGTLKSGKGGKGGRVTSRKQAIAIGLSEAREKGEKVPPRKRSSRKSSSRKTTTARKSSATRKRSTSRKRSTATRKRSTARKRSR